MHTFQNPSLTWTALPFWEAFGVGGPRQLAGSRAFLGVINPLGFMLVLCGSFFGNYFGLLH